MNIYSQLKHTITYWRVTGSDGYGGYTFATPITIKARWEDSQEKFISTDGEESVSRAVVFIDRSVTVGDYLAEGDFTTTDNPDDVSGAFPVRAFSRITNLRNTQTLRTAFL